MPEQEQTKEQPILDLRSEPVQEIIGRDPNWIIRWGITVIFMTVLILLYGTWVIKYPEIVSSRISITTQQPPVRVVARNSGKLQALFVAEGETVVANQYLALLETTADFEQVIALRERLDAFRGFLVEPQNYLDVQWEKDMVLGELQLYYGDFLKAFNSYRTYINENHNGAQVKVLKEQVAHYRSLNDQMTNQKALQAQELALYKKKFENNQNLFERKMISETDLADSQGNYLQKQLALKNGESNIINNTIRIDVLQKSILELRQQYQERRRSLELDAQEAYKGLHSDFATWEKEYVLKAPAAGRVSFFRFWSDNQYVTTGEEVLVILPKLNELVGKIYLPQFNAGKVEIGQRVNIKFDSYPFREFGMVVGQVQTGSVVARDNVYLINISLPNQLHTTYDKDLEFKYNMEGSADIITRDLRLIERIFNQFRYIFTSKV